MEILAFGINAVFVYWLSDVLVRLIERRRGSALKQRQVVFFILFLVLALVTFRLLGEVFSGA